VFEQWTLNPYFQFFCGERELRWDHRAFLISGVPTPNATAYAKRKTRARFRRRAAIELRIGHLKSDFWLGRNFLRDVQGDAINFLLAATAANLRLWVRAASADLAAIFASFLPTLHCALFPR
jgi:hypothetical protein